MSERVVKILKAWARKNVQDALSISIFLRVYVGPILKGCQVDVNYPLIRHATA